MQFKVFYFIKASIAAMVFVFLRRNFFIPIFRNSIMFEKLN